jgi:hypothetical protein
LVLECNPCLYCCVIHHNPNLVLECNPCLYCCCVIHHYPNLVLECNPCLYCCCVIRHNPNLLDELKTSKTRIDKPPITWWIIYLFIPILWCSQNDNQSSIRRFSPNWQMNKIWKWAKLSILVFFFFLGLPYQNPKIENLESLIQIIFQKIDD